MRLASSLASTLLVSPTLVLGAYNLVRDYSGTNFFSGWDFYGNYDNLTNGDVIYVNQTNATNLAYRNSVRITSQDYFPIGTVWVMDAAHMPFGCSVWPSIWTKGVNWPIGGEIDIIEGVNLMTYNQMALHTENGCTQSTTLTQSGQTGSTNCSSVAGCTVVEEQASSYGSSFASAGGGVWATQLDTSGIYVWFWTRDNIPSSVSSATDTIDPSTWGTPSAAYPSSSCNISEFFTPQQLVVDITLCGDWAGGATVYQATCGGDGTADACYLDNVIGNGTNYNNAYFEINYIKAFTVNSTVLSPTTSGGSAVLETSTSTATSIAASGTGASTQSGSGAAATWNPLHAYAAVVGTTAISALSWLLL
ncbi:putative glycosidase C21B10.07 [Grifola frondosa]|uniref:Putative glycosidase C21B10.07 n=1 Tax=Grifola frondosa TaxID=5627 RepID=A0A1C7MCR6_GRIFR|nr:putative glycosidase C21B10.07 [Grifola frondosa]